MKIPASSILVIRMSGVGDVLWTTPFLAGLRRGYPDARISYIVRKGCVPVLENNSDVDELIVYDDDRIRKQALFLRRLRAKRFDMSIDFICTPGTAIQSLVSGARHRIGFDFHGRKHFYNHRLSAHAANYGHEVEFHLFVLDYLGLPVVTRDLVWNISEDEKRDAEEIRTGLRLPSDRPVIAMIPTGGFASKKWPVEHYSRLAGAVIENTDSRILLFWGNAEEKADAERIREVAAERIDLIPPSSLRRLAALLAKCSMAIGNDSGPLHIATAMRIPVVGLYGRTNIKSQGPWGANVHTLQPPGQPTGPVPGPDFVPAPMSDLKPEPVIEKTLSILKTIR
jgi:ADP-heptose:LPS heptosyltransferase